MSNYDRIELFGYPGSGKTTALEKIAAVHPDFTPQKANISPTIGNLLKLLFFLISNPTMMQLFKWRKYAPPKYSKLYLNTIIRFMLRMMTAENDIKRRRKNIVDEGVLQITWSLLLIPTVFEADFNLEEELERIIRYYWPKSDILIYYIKIDQKEYIARINSRERSHFFSKEYMKENEVFIKSGEKIFDLILKKTERKYFILPV